MSELNYVEDRDPTAGEVAAAIARIQASEDGTTIRRRRERARVKMYGAVTINDIEVPVREIEVARERVIFVRKGKEVGGANSITEWKVFVPSCPVELLNTNGQLQPFTENGFTRGNVLLDRFTHGGGAEPTAEFVGVGEFSGVRVDALEFH